MSFHYPKFFPAYENIHQEVLPHNIDIRMIFMERTQVFVAKLLEWADKTRFRDFAYRHETASFRKLCLAVLL